jgi:hypothetical protein
MALLDRWKKFFFSSPVPRVERVGEVFTVTASAYDTDPLVGKGANAYTLLQFQTLPSVNMLMGNGRIPPTFFKALGQNNLVALRPAGAPQDVVGVPVGVTDLFPEPTEA